MNMNVWISKQEEKHLSKVAADMEYALMWGHSPYAEKVKLAMLAAQELFIQGKTTLEQSQNICKMLNSKANDDIDFAITLIEHLSTPKSTQHVSNISVTESQVPKSRS
jgi:hypothetical protein